MKKHLFFRINDFPHLSRQKRERRAMFSFESIMGRLPLPWVFLDKARKGVAGVSALSVSVETDIAELS